MSGADRPAPANPDHALMLRVASGAVALPCPVDTSPMAHGLGCRLVSWDGQAGKLELEFEPDATYLQGQGVIQGGAVVAMLDFAMALVVMSRLPEGRSCATVNLNASFLRPASQGRFRAVGVIERLGRTLGFAQATLARHSDGTPIATASSTLSLGG